MPEKETKLAPAAAEDRDFLKNLITACVNGESKKVQKSIIQYCLKEDLSQTSILKNFKDGSKRTPIHFAAQSLPNKNEDVDIISLLLKKTNFPMEELQSIVSTKDVDGLTPLMLICQNMHKHTLERIKVVLDIDPKTPLARSKTGATALHYAAGAGASKEVIELLYNHGKVSLKAFTKQGSTPLHWASSDPPPKNYSETIQTLIDLGSDLNNSGEEGQSIPPLVVAVASGNDVHAKILVENGADRGLLMSGGVTCYHMAADLNLQKTLQAMIEADGNVADSISAKCLSSKNQKGETPLDLAAQRGHFESFKIMCGESDEEKAKERMLTLQKEWNDKNKDSPKEDNEPKAIAIDEEAEAKTAAAMLVANPPTISEDDNAKAVEFKTKGNGHYAKSEWEEAVSMYSIAIELNPMDKTYYSNRSACYLKLGKNEEALNDAVICRYLDPKWVKGCFRLSHARLALGRFEDAAVAAWEGLNLDEGNPELETLVTKCIKLGRKEHKANKAGK